MIKQNEYLENLLVSKIHSVQISAHSNTVRYMDRVNFGLSEFLKKRKQKAKTKKNACFKVASLCVG